MDGRGGGGGSRRLPNARRDYPRPGKHTPKPLSGPSHLPNHFLLHNHNHHPLPTANYAAELTAWPQLRLKVITTFLLVKVNKRVDVRLYPPKARCLSVEIQKFNPFTGTALEGQLLERCLFSKFLSIFLLLLFIFLSSHFHDMITRDSHVWNISIYLKCMLTASVLHLDI